MRRSGSGVLLAPKGTAETDLYPALVQRSVFTQTFPPGGGFIVRAGEVERVQVLFPDALPVTSTYSH